MSRISRVATTVFTVLCMILPGCAATLATGQGRAHLDDATLTSRVKNAVSKDPGLQYADINIQTVEGTVQLSGVVNSGDKIRKLFELACSVEGVTLVQNNVQLR